MADSEKEDGAFSARNHSEISADNSESDFYDSDEDPEYIPSDVENQLKKRALKYLNSPQDVVLKENDEASENETEHSDTEENTSQDENVEIPIRKGRKRKRGKGRQNEEKERRNRGKNYRTYRGKGKDQEEKVLGPDCNCKRKCFSSFTEEERRTIFNAFWEMQSFNLQNSYIFGCLEVKNKGRSTKSKDHNSRRSHTVYYYIMSKSRSSKVQVCKRAFLSILGLQKNRGRLENIVKTIKDGALTPKLDGRGTHLNHKKKYDDAQVNNVKSFIERLPKYQSHYSRSDNPNSFFMTMEYTVEKCYDVYKDECLKEGVNFVSSDKFRRIFTEDFNIKFKSPKTDTCSVCDSINVALKNAELNKNPDAINKLKVDQELHHRKAKAGQDAIKWATIEATQNETTYAITFDLQQALPTPKLSTGPTFYKKKMFCYNFSIHSLHPSQGYFYMWDESTAGRGAEEIGSCLLRHFSEHNIRGSKLIAISDNCGGQNKNWVLVSVWLRLLAQGTFQEILHIFPQVGHTMLPSDRDFAYVEKYVRAHCQYVYTPDEWEQVLRSAQKKNPFIVHRMAQNDFFKISDLRNTFQQPKAFEEIGIRNSVRIRCSAKDLDAIEMSNTYSGDFTSLSIKKRGRPGNIKERLVQNLEKKYSTTLPIDQGKLEHVLSCLSWIPSVHHPFYTNLHSK